MTDEKPPEVQKPRSKRIYVYWGVALVLLLLGTLSARRAWECACPSGGT